jgi:hypothetical protein
MRHRKRFLVQVVLIDIVLRCAGERFGKKKSSEKGKAGQGLPEKWFGL